MSTLEVKKLTLGYGPRVLIKSLSFELSNASFVAILGHNGCGKSSFFKSLINAIPYQGNIFIDGKDLQNISTKAISNTISFLEQKNLINFSIPVEELVVMGRFNRKSLFENYNEEDYILGKNCMDLLEIGHYAKIDFKDLSGGEQQMAWLAQSMLQDAQIYLFDEPTQQLDVYNKKKIFDLFLKMVEEKNKTVLCITHDMNNLYAMKGYLLNLSLANPQLEIINDESVSRNIKFLEGRNITAA